MSVRKASPFRTIGGARLLQLRGIGVADYRDLERPSDNGLMAGPEERTVTLELTYDEAVVLFEWTHPHEDQDYAEPMFIDKAEEVAFWSLTAVLEPLIDEVFSSTYRDVLEAAKSRLTPED
jgi:hypothetical protein